MALSSSYRSVIMTDSEEEDSGWEVFAHRRVTWEYKALDRLPDPGQVFESLGA